MHKQLEAQFLLDAWLAQEAQLEKAFLLLKEGSLQNYSVLVVTAIIEAFPSKNGWDVGLLFNFDCQKGEYLTTTTSATCTHYLCLKCRSV